MRSPMWATGSRLRPRATLARLRTSHARSSPSTTCPSCSALTRRVLSANGRSEELQERTASRATAWRSA
eukprot:6555193-Pyramimonas_sp.AAC.1